MSEQDNMSPAERCALIAGPRSAERCALIAGGWDAWDVPGALPDPGDRIEWRNTDGTRSGVIDSYQVGPGAVTLAGVQKTAGLVDTDFFWRVVDDAPDTVRSGREPEPPPPDSARDCAIRALGDAIERPHDGRLAEAVDALRDYALDGSRASAPPPEPAPRHDAIPPPPRGPFARPPLEPVTPAFAVLVVLTCALLGVAIAALPWWLIGAAIGAGSGIAAVQEHGVRRG